MVGLFQTAKNRKFVIVKIAQHIASLLLACLMFISSTGFSMYKHYCGGNLKEISLFEEAESCHETELVKQQKESCPFHKHDNKELEAEDNCCTDEYKRIVLEDQVKQLDKNQTSSAPIELMVTDLGYLQKVNFETEQSAPKPFLTDVLTNGPPLYLWFSQFNFYG